MDPLRHSHRALAPLLCGLAGLMLLTACPTQTAPPEATAPGTDVESTAPPPAAFEWNVAFDASGLGALSAVWGSGPSDIFVVGGKPKQGEVVHFDGATWRAMAIPNVGLLVWVYGFGPADVYAVGMGGGAIHYDGAQWTKLESGVTQALWGVWGTGPKNIWIVGGDTGFGEAVLLHYDGSKFTPWPMPSNDRNATALFKVWGIGSKVFAVGEKGLIIQFDGAKWFQVPAGANADDDFVSLWGTSESNIVAVGGRSSARIATYDGTSWSTIKPAGVPGLNASFMAAPDTCLIGGLNGYVGTFDPLTGALTGEQGGTTLTVHAIWDNGAGVSYAVGGRFNVPFTGLALIRTAGAPGFAPTAPVPLDASQVAPPADNPPATNPPPDESPAITDCNGNGTDDAADISSGASGDCNGNGVPDECDPDGDGDGVPDQCDRCARGDDALDSDHDGVPNACDTCGLGADSADSDNDGVADACDLCPGADDNLDSDRDGTPDCLDSCPSDPAKIDPGICGCGTADTSTDSDGDGVVDCLDVCPGGDDSKDIDGDGIPNLCDGPEMVLGIADPNQLGFNELNNGDTFPFVCGFQGAFADAFVNLHLIGFGQPTPENNVLVVVRISVVRISDGAELAAGNTPIASLFWNATEQLHSIFNFSIRPAILTNNPPTDGVEAEVTLTVEDVSDSSITATVRRTVFVDLRGPFCP